MSTPAIPPANEAIHFTMFNFKADMSVEDCEAVMNVTRGLGPLKTVQHLVIGKAAPHTRPSTGNFDYISIVGFDNTEDHAVYMVCAERMAMGAVFMPTQTGFLHADIHHPGLSVLWNTKGDRLRHVMFFGFQARTPAAERDRLLAAVRALGESSKALAFTLSRNYKDWTPNSCAEWMIIADFADQAAFDAFLASPDYKATVEDDLLTKTSVMFQGELQITPQVSGLSL